MEAELAASKSNAEVDIEKALAAIKRASAVYCRGELLDAVQRCGLFQDSKHFVDMPMLAEPEEVLKAFQELPAVDRADVEVLRAFVKSYFEDPDAELIPHTPEDFPAESPLIASVADAGLRELLQALHGLWPTLCRVLAPKVQEMPQRYSALPRKWPVVLPGGRFRETYYWDSYWILEGLLTSGMTKTAQGLTQNLLDDVQAFGFVPNGGRIYYLNRSQPPLLCDMVASVARTMDAQSSVKWLAAAVPLLQKEHEWWMGGAHVVTVGDFTLNRYLADWDFPRPESYREDVETANGNTSIYRELASAAESGWDFSARWTREGGRVGGTFKLQETATTMIIPVDLNAILYRAEMTLAAMLQAVATQTPLCHVESLARGSFTDSSADAMLHAATKRRKAIDALMWQPHLGRWVDVWLPVASDGAADSPCAVDRAPMLSDFAAPLWAGLPSSSSASAIVAALRSSGLIDVAGVKTTGVAGSGQQWDAPNGWPPLQSMLIEGLQRLDVSSGGRVLAAELAQKWVGTCYAAWKRTGFMYEKYDCSQFGIGGGGGEYEPQVGFGWSNGVVLQLLRDFGQNLTSTHDG